jgi:integrase
MTPKLRKTPFSIVSKRPHLRYQVEWSEADGRHRKFFSNRMEASAFLSDLELKVAKVGVDAASVDPETVRAWLDLDRRTKAAGGTLEGLVEAFERRQVARGRSKPVSEAVEAFLRQRERLGRSERTVYALRSRLRPFVRDFGDRLVAEIEFTDVDRFLASVPGKALTRNHSRAALHGFFAWAMKNGICDGNPVSAVEKATVRPKIPGVLKPEELRIAFALAPAAMWPELALGAFAGLRESEIQRLRWDDVDLSRGIVDLRRIETKNNASRRIVDLLPACRAFLEESPAAPFGKKSFVLPRGQDKMRRRLRTNLRKNGVTWPANALRHSFASYHLALYQDGGKLALQLGHGGGMAVLLHHYREIVTPEAAKEWFEIRPEGVRGEKVSVFSRSA